MQDQTCPLIRLDKARRRDKSVGFSVSLGIHIVILILVGISIVKPPQFGVEQGLGGIEVDLVGAQAEPEIKALERVTVPEQMVEQINDFEEKQAVSMQEIKKESNKDIRGKDQLTIKSTGGAISEAKPDYLKNPSPSYPEVARRKKQQGTVMLTVLISRDGQPVEISIEKSSGHSLLDQAAVKAVKKWQFRPAMIGSMVIESTVRVPIRFQM